MEMLQEHSPDTNTYASNARICIVPPRELIALKKANVLPVYMYANAL